MPMSRRAAGTDEMSLPSTRTDPVSAVSNPATMRSAVVLPQPDGPSRATSSPGAIWMDRPSRARVAPKARGRARRRTLAPTARSRRGDELTGRHLDGQAVQGRGGAEGAGQVAQQDARAARALGLPDGVGRVGGVPGGVGGHQSPRVSVRATVNKVTSPPPVLRDCLLPRTVMTSKKTQVTNSASSEAATETWPLVWLLT